MHPPGWVLAVRFLASQVITLVGSVHTSFRLDSIPVIALIGAASKAVSTVK